MRAVMLVPAPGGATIGVQDIPKPQPARGEVIVKVHAAALNRGELVVRAKLTNGTPQQNGIEFAGEIVQVGEGASGVSIGDRVMGHWRAGQSEYVNVEPRLLVQIPEKISWVDAAAWLNVFTTAHDAIITNAGLKTGESILVNAASSGIGIASLQIANLLGAKPVIGSSRSSSKLTALKDFGLMVGVNASTSSTDYISQVMEATEGKGVDVIIDSVGANVIGLNLSCMALGGRIVSVGRLAAEKGEIDLDLLALKRIKLFGVTFRTRSLEQRVACVRRCQEDLWQAFADGRLISVVDRTFPLEDISIAHDYMRQDQHIGKIVMTL